MNRRRFLRSSALWLPVAFAVPARAVNPFARPSSVAALTRRSASCATLKDSHDTAGLSTIVGDHAANDWLALRFLSGSSYVCCSVALWLNKVASPTFSLSAGIYTEDTGLPGVIIGGWSTAVPASTLGAAYGWQVFSGLSSSISSGTQYWIVLKVVTPTDDWTNYVQAGSEWDGVKTEVQIGSDGLAWTADATKVSTFRTYAS